MSKQIFINLPIKDLKRAMAFYEAIGFTNNPQFTDETAACMVWSDNIFVMLLTHDKFKQFISKSIKDAKQTVGVINALSLENNDEVNAFLEKAVKAGGREYADPKDYGFMQQRCVEDLDGHNWEVFYMDMTKFPA
ncbi:MAG: glyoxalase/bleomycin resistance/extradiol dioxygenase family protein [Chitinophagaceae bacterium]|nr:glyoxalase/bleomycin resistance/extradiol dioxygenase family protein [Chitinophagaceae bacterium]